mmetsp:Transcript_21390/g.34843  ORF Transcript_21390/g.34843 Transcript_21390/m.34843 type:complete len:666 (+) Transcript_21390:99-2096(+)
MSEKLLTPPKAPGDDAQVDSRSARRALIEQGRKRMEEFRNRSASKEQGDASANISFEGKDERVEAMVPFTPVAKGLKSQLDKLKRDELDLAASEWSEQRTRMSDMRKAYEEDIEKLEKQLEQEREKSCVLEKENAIAVSKFQSEEMESRSLAQRVQHANELVEAEREENRQLRVKVKTLASDLEERARDTVNRLANKESELTSDLEDMKKQISSQQDSYNALEREKCRLDEQLREAKLTIQSLEKVAAERVETIENLTRNSVQEKERQKQALQEAENRVSRLNNSLGSKIEYQSNQIVLLETRLEGEKERLANEREQFQKSLDEAKAQRHSVNEQQHLLEEQQSQIVKLKDQLSRFEHVNGRLEMVEQNLEKSISTNKEIQNSNGLLRGDLEKRNAIISMLEAKVKELEGANKAFECETKAFQDSQADGLKERIVELKRDLQEANGLLREQEALTRMREQALHDAKSDHIRELREQGEQFNRALEEQKQAQQRLQRLQESDSAVDQMAFQKMEEEIQALRRRLEQDGEATNAALISAADNHADAQSLEQLQKRVVTLEQTNQTLLKTLEKDKIYEQAKTIHQLTLEVDEGRKRLQEAGLDHSTSSSSTEELKQALEDAIVREKLEAKARRKAENKIAFLQSDFTDLFFEYFNKEKKRRSKNMKSR